MGPAAQPQRTIDDEGVFDAIAAANLIAQLAALGCTRVGSCSGTAESRRSFPSTRTEVECSGAAPHAPVASCLEVRKTLT